MHSVGRYYVIPVPCARHPWVFGVSVGPRVLCHVSSALKYQGNTSFFLRKQLTINLQYKDLRGVQMPWKQPWIQTKLPDGMWVERTRY